jgi:hypothetical protein
MTQLHFLLSCAYAVTEECESKCIATILQPTNGAFLKNIEAEQRLRKRSTMESEGDEIDGCFHLHSTFEEIQRRLQGQVSYCGSSQTAYIDRDLRAKNLEEVIRERDKQLEEIIEERDRLIRDHYLDLQRAKTQVALLATSDKCKFYRFFHLWLTLSRSVMSANFF